MASLVAPGGVIDIDTGGTFTDGVFRLNGSAVAVKVDTTPHDPVRCFVDCLEAGSANLGLDLAELLRLVQVIRYCTTATTNAIIQRKGARVGLLVSEGAQQTLYQPEARAALGSFVEPELIRGIREDVRLDGSIARELDAEQFRSETESLLDVGARLLIVAFRNACKNPWNELRARQLFRMWFPTQYLGTPFLLLSHQVSARGTDAEHLNSALVSGYLHRELVGYLYRCDEAVRSRGFRRPLLVVHSSGGLARVAKTTALHTYNSGPTAGVFGAARIARQYGLRQVVSMDMGGTSTDVAFLEDGRPKLTFQAQVEGLRLSLPMIDVIGLGGGGGSIATVRGGSLHVGPESAGAVPGPACYDLGSMLPTVTDADVVLGFIAPDNFLGGRRALNADRARRALQEGIAAPRDVSVEAAALQVRAALAQKLASEIRREAGRRSFELEQAQMFAYGGAGPVHAADVADGLGISTFYVFPESPVFSAAGCASMNVAHYYETVVRRKDGIGSLQSLRDAMSQLADRARRDLRGEGFDETGSCFSFQLETAEGRQHPLDLPDSVHELELGLLEESVLSLKATAQEVTDGAPPLRWSEDRATRSGRPVTRTILWKTGVHETPVRSFFALQEGEEIPGPAVLESGETCCVIPEGWRACRDRFGAVRVWRVLLQAERTPT